MSTPHESRLNQALRGLLHTQRIASLGTLGVHGEPFVSMVPYAIEPAAGCLIMHVSLLAPHTRNMLSHPEVSVMVMQPERSGEPVHALPRVSIDGTIKRLLPDSSSWVAAQQVYLERFPEAEPMMQLGDFSFMAFFPSCARHVAGFGSARPLETEDIVRLLRLP